jgi:peptidoglycan/LPS O-acetylase OafA/YrhL
LRALAILLVFAGYFGADFEAAPRIPRFPLFNLSWTGVDLFFVLSGALIGSQLWKELQRTGRIKVGRFLLRRGLRIWPLYFSLLAVLVAQVVFVGRNGSGLWSDALCVSNYFHHQISGGWSLSTEEQFYILAPLLLLLLSFWFKPRLLWIGPVGAMIGVIAARAVVISRSTLNEYDLRQYLYFPIHTHADGLAAGVLIAWCWVFLPDHVRSTRWRVSVAAAMFVGGIALYAANRILFNFTSLALIFGALTLLGAGLKNPPALLRWRGFHLISRLSYGIYLNHFGVLARLQKFLLPWRHSGGGPAFWILFLSSFLC